jgi:hypothetical protein
LAFWRFGVLAFWHCLSGVLGLGFGRLASWRFGVFILEFFIFGVCRDGVFSSGLFELSQWEFRVWGSSIFLFSFSWGSPAAERHLLVVQGVSSDLGS